jgi:hypothetical protein
MKADQKVDGYLQNGVIAGVRLKCGSGYGTDAERNGTDGVKMRNGTERMGLKCGTDGVKMRNGTDMGLKCGTERNGYGVKMRNGTDMGLKCGTERIWG